MRCKIVSFALMLLVVLYASPVRVWAQTYTDPWMRVKSVPVGDTLTVKLKNGKSVDGEKQVATDDSLSLLRMGQVVEIKRAEILKIYLHLQDSSNRRGPRGLSGALLGGLAGLLVFGVLNAGDSGRSGEDQRRYTRATAMLIPAGAGVGFVIDRTVIDRAPACELIYENK
jgi:hypothetical protein